MKYSAALIASVAVAQAAPVDQVCKVVTSVVYGQPTWVPNNAAATWSPVPQSPAAQSTSSAWASWTGKSPEPASQTTTSAWASWTGKTPAAATTTTTSAAWVSWTSKATPEPTSKTTTANEWVSWTTTPAAAVTTTTSAHWDHRPTTTKAATTTTTAASQPAPTCGSGQSKTTVQWAGYYWDLYCGWGVDQTTVQNMRTAGTLKFWEATPKVQYDSPAECEALCAKDSTCGSVVYTNDPKANANDYKRCWLTDNLPRPNTATYGQISYKLHKA